MCSVVLGGFWCGQAKSGEGGREGGREEEPWSWVVGLVYLLSVCLCGVDDGLSMSQVRR